MSSPELPGGSPTRAETPGWWERPGNLRKLAWIVAALAIALLAVDFLVPRHGPFALEQLFGFYAWFGFVAAGVLVLPARAWRALVMRPKDYYDE